MRDKELEDFAREVTKILKEYQCALLDHKKALEILYERIECLEKKIDKCQRGGKEKIWKKKI